MSHAPYVIAPRDGFFAKDGRGWFTSASGRARGLAWPWPTTIRGALRAAYGRGLEDEADAPLDREDWPARTEGVALGASLPLLGEAGSWSAADRLWPVPADALYAVEDRAVRRLDPRPPPSAVQVARFGADAAAAAGLWRPALDKGKPGPRPRWWTEGEFSAWLAGGSVPYHDAEARAGRSPQRRVDLHLQIAPDTATAAEGMLFSTELCEADAADGRRWAVAAQVAVPEGRVLGGLTFLGGKRRLARIERPAADLFAPPADRADGPSPGLRVYVVTPACFAAGWRPDRFDLDAGGRLVGRLPGVDGAVALRAAMVGRPEPVAGWDMRDHRPKPIRRLVPAGSVYFFTRVDGRPFSAAERDALWLSALPQADDDLADGLGRAVAAPWHPAADDASMESR